MQSYLLKCFDLGLTREPPNQVRKYLKIIRSPNNAVQGATYSIAVGDVANFRRDPSQPHFSRKPDGWWFDFQLSVQEDRDGLLILAYGFELRPPPNANGPFSFVRFDLNGPEHANDGRGLRSHLHLGTDDDGFSVPAPIMSPIELLDLCVHGIGASRRSRL